MGVQHEHAHLHHLKARQDMGENKYNFIHMAGKARDDGNNGSDNGDENVVTIISKVYVTEPKTFPGPAIYVTKTDTIVETIGQAVPTTTMDPYEAAKSKANEPKTRSSYPEGVVGTPLSQPADQSKGMSGGEKAGVAFGVIAAIALVAALVFFCVRRRKAQTGDRGERLDEKHISKNSFFGGTAAAFGAPAGDKRASVKSFNSTHTASTAPRLSLRPVTQFLPSILERNKNNNNNLDAPPMSEKSRSASPQNPFSDRSATNAFEEADGKGSNHSTQPSWESGSTGTAQVGTAAAVPVGGSKGQNNVHRVQLEFKPSMDDELELKSGQLVRMLHEYDDGWALCIRMDRTQQGVCPRTCLSKLPVKPRPQGPPQGRGSPPGFRGPPQQGPNKMMPRPLTPTGRERASSALGHHASPAAQEASRKRSMSVNSAERAVSPIDNTVPARKPLPAQAM